MKKNAKSVQKHYKLSKESAWLLASGTLIVFLLSFMLLMTYVTNDCNCQSCVDGVVRTTIIPGLTDDLDGMEKTIPTKYYGTYLPTTGEIHTLILKKNNEFTLEINLMEGYGTVTGHYAIVANEAAMYLVLYSEPYQYTGFAGSYKWHRVFKIESNDSLTYIDEMINNVESGYASDMIETRTNFIKK